MSLKVTRVTENGGAVTLNEKEHVWASYRVATAGSRPPHAILRANARLPDGRGVEFFLNVESGLVVVDVIDKGSRGGCEILRRNLCS